MKRRMLILVFLSVSVALLVFLEPEQEVYADACSNCDTTHQSSLGRCQNDYDRCLSDMNPEYICYDQYTSCEGNADEVWIFCKNANCGGGGGGGGTSDCSVGYFQSCVMDYCGYRADCKLGNPSGDFSDCQGLTGDDLNQCCDADYNKYVFDLQVCYCDPYRDPRHFSCKCIASCS